MPIGRTREYPRLDLHGAYVPGTSLRRAILHDANLAGTNASFVDFRDADFLDANLNGTVLLGANLAGAKNLTLEQLSEAIIDDATILPDYIDRAALASAR